MTTGLTVAALSDSIDNAPHPTPLARLSAASATATELRELSDALLDRYVQAARADGRSWTEIGAALGITKQAAHERFVNAPLAWPTHFNEPARRVVARAVAEARGFGHRYLGTEHLLLALAADGGLAGAALADLGLDEPTVRREIESMIGRGRSGVNAALGITPRTKRVFETAIKEAKRLGGRRCAETEDILLALALSKGAAADILARHGADERAVREQLATLLEREAPELAAKLRAPERRRSRRGRALAARKRSP
jgi:hypothetical protein